VKRAPRIAKNSSGEKTPPQKPSYAKPSETDRTLLIDRRASRDRRTAPDRRVANVPVPVERRKLQRRAKVSRRRQIDPTTCERDYSAEEIEFMGALDDYKRTSGRMFPTCSEILEVLRNLGYEKRPVDESAATSPPPASPAIGGNRQVGNPGVVL